MAYPSPMTPGPPPAISRLVDTLAAGGLNVVGTVDVAQWDTIAPASRQSVALLPGARCILVFGSGGPDLWSAFLADLRRDPRGLTEEVHPLDAFVARQVAAADPLLGTITRRWFHAAATEATPIDFRLLAHLGGLGTRSRPGILLHPRFGLWMGLRAACFVDVALPADAPLTVSPCDTCPSPCMAACPGGAFVDGALAIARCAHHNRTTTDCATACHARAACPEGAAFRYTPEEQAYHTNPNQGRRWLRTYLGIPPGRDHHEGDAPPWGAWTAE